MLVVQQSKQSKASIGGASKDRYKERDHSNGGLRYLAHDWSPSLDDELSPRQGKAATMSVEHALARSTPCRRRRKNEFPRMSHTHRSSFHDYLAVDEVPTMPTEKKLTTRRSISPEDFQHVDRVGGVLGSKRKRLQINVDEYSEWMDIQELLQPAPGVVPTVVTIDGHDFEEYEVTSKLRDSIIFSVSEGPGLSVDNYHEKSLLLVNFFNTVFLPCRSLLSFPRDHVTARQKYMGETHTRREIELTLRSWHVRRC